MKIVVCIKQVPDTTEVRLDPKTGTLIRDGVPSIINPDDKSGLEAAIRIKEKVGGEITVLTMGPLQAENALREALAMGADRGILLTDRAFAGADTWATSQTLAAAIRKLDFDLIIAGRQAIDGDTAQVGPQIAEHLKLTQVSYVEDLKLEGHKLLVKRIFEDSFQWIRVSTPCLITTLKEMNEPRYMSVGGVFDAFREKEIIRWNLGDIEVDLANIGLKGSPTKVKKSFTKGVKGKGEIFQDLSPNEAAKLIAERLREKFII
ncbi:electron transfer flavoprotein subunit beta/FixA family protein [Alkalicella caledoniensis]|uniref:Electron transfer flavoprotein small subunit n=1 Tax=Alkalicella caledoniensis TaxID=2731377 RepID=A0A7G9W5C9_ALKCA|nr:electron transfer flavoprotein subunit beta/FixA family protein [Alkalicella caledoniensis]QNO13891.1 electron transfer flavoprotein subunit beta/FixA family protein [Alkalicella caledoniensis]